MSEETLVARIQYLLNDADIRSYASVVADKWLQLLKRGKPVRRHELLGAVRGATRTAPTQAVPKWWRDEMRVRLGLVKGLDKASKAMLLERWPRVLLQDPSWSLVEAPLPELDPLPLEEVWTDLGLLPAVLRPAPLDDSDVRSVTDLSREGDFDRDAQRNAETVNAYLERLRRSLLVVGQPGAGKTTLLKWVARRLLVSRESRFKFPMFISLRNYALRKRHEPNLSLTDFFCHTCELESGVQTRAWRHALARWADPARELSDLRNTTLLLLDGWDEVPTDLREAVRRAIEEVMLICPTIITSRPSGFPASLGAEQLCHIAGLSDEGVSRLIENFFATTKAAGREDLVRSHMDAHPDLWRLARNPFLLTLLCAISLTSRRAGVDSLPTTRFQLYRRTISAIYEHHNRRYPQAPFSARHQRKAQHFALWLMEDAPAAPSYVFTAEDVATASRDASWFEPVLSRSRLVSASPEDQDLFRFLHATFQEYLAAQALLERAGREDSERLSRRFYDLAWVEVMRFASGLAKPDRAAEFWRHLAEIARAPDRFGFVYARLARLLGEAGEADGGRALLGFDLREKLWGMLTTDNSDANEMLVSALVELDQEECVRRADAGLTGTDNKRQLQMLDIMTRSPRHLVSGTLFRLMTGEDERLSPEAREWAIENASGALAEPERARLRAMASDAKLMPDERIEAITALGSAADFSSVPALHRLVNETPDEEDEQWYVVQAAIESLGRIGGGRAADALSERWESAENKSENTRYNLNLLMALSMTGESSARRVLLHELVTRPPDDPLALPILHYLYGVHVWRDAAVLTDFLVNGRSADIRAAAARSLHDCSDISARGPLIRAAQNDPSREVREAAMEVLINWVEPGDVDWLLERSMRGTERAQALQILLVAAHAFGPGHEGSGIRAAAFKSVLHALKRPRGARARVAAMNAHMLGPLVAERLLAVCRSPSADMEVRRSACEGLGTIGYEKAAEYFVELINAHPDVDIRLRRRDDESESSLVPEAAKALARIDPTKLLNIEGLAARQALAWFSADTGHLVFEDKILDPAGRVLRRARRVRSGEGRADADAGEPLQAAGRGDESGVEPQPVVAGRQDGRLKILLFSASADGASKRRLEDEARAIRQNLRASKYRDRIDLVPVMAARPGDLLDEMNIHQPHIVQFSGDANRHDEIILLDDSGAPKPVRKEALISLFKSAAEKVQVVVLNTRYSKAQAEAIVSVVPCAIGMEGALGGEAARVFASFFYGAIGFGHSVKTAFQQGRTAIMLWGIPEAHRPRLLARRGVDPGRVVLIYPEVDAPG